MLQKSSATEVPLGVRQAEWSNMRARHRRGGASSQVCKLGSFQPPASSFSAVAPDHSAGTVRASLEGGQGASDVLMSHADRATRATGLIHYPYLSP